MRPAILAALVYSFVRAMTAISAVILLVSAQYNMATAYIIGQVENNEYGVAIAYTTTLILVMLAAVGLRQDHDPAADCRAGNGHRWANSDR